MKMNGAVLWGPHEDWSVEEIDLDGPRDGEVLVSWEATACATRTTIHEPVTRPRCCPPSVGTRARGSFRRSALG